MRGFGIPNIIAAVFACSTWARAELALDVTLTPSSIVVGQPVQITYGLSNAGKDAISGDLCLDHFCGLIGLEISSGDSSGGFLSASLLNGATLERVPIERSLQPGQSIEYSACLIYDVRAEGLAFPQAGDYQVRAGFASPVGNVISKWAPLHVDSPSGEEAVALDFIQENGLEPYLCDEAAYYDVPKKVLAALDTVTKKYAKTPYAAGAEEALRALGVRGRLVVQPSELQFGAQPVGDMKTSRAVQLVNSGRESIIIAKFAGLRPPFSLAQSTTLPKTLEPDGFMEVVIDFRPETTGLARSSLTVESSGGSATVVVEGEGSPSPAIQVSPVQVDFGRNSPGLSAVERVTVTNVGMEDLLVSAVSTVSGPFRASIPKLPWMIRAGESVELEFVFAAERGVFSGLAVLESNDPWYPQARIHLHGEGAEPASGCGCALLRRHPHGSSDVDAALLIFLGLVIKRFRGWRVAARLPVRGTGAWRLRRHS